MQNEKMSVLWAKQFTKRIIILAFIGWVVGGIFGIGYEIARLTMSPDVANIDGLLVYFATPLTCGLPSYIIPNLFLKQKQVEYGIDPERKPEEEKDDSVIETVVE